ncbi:hypothetical protein BCR44DRAFT_1428376 [Catenaria anguillulae PL171]|uniref:Uncharacterized protein n=1 Tax=Catenaria anguillulae PL171 TaxID=765915 RepID=A0A1Y2HV56_9FUNG|nr:hypothetical protein BCR44DRAFT_1428376 [Catenaria anguillulae PL171]
MVAPPYLVRLAFLTLPTAPIDEIADPLLCVTRFAHPSPSFVVDVALPMFKSVATKAHEARHTMIDRLIVGLSEAGNVNGLNKCRSIGLIEESTAAVLKHMAVEPGCGRVHVLVRWCPTCHLQARGHRWLQGHWLTVCVQLSARAVSAP